MSAATTPTTISVSGTARYWCELPLLSSSLHNSGDEISLHGDGRRIEEGDEVSDGRRVEEGKSVECELERALFIIVVVVDDVIEVEICDRSVYL